MPTGTRRFRGSLRLPPRWTRRARSLGASPALPDLGRRPRGLPAPHPLSGPRATLPPPTPRTPFGPQALAPGSSALPDGQGKCGDKPPSSRPAAPAARDPGKPGRPGSPKLERGAGGAYCRGRGLSRRGPSTPTPAAALGPRRPGGPLGRDSRCPGRGTVLTRGRSHAATAGVEQQRPQPAEPRRPLHAAPRSEPGRAAASAVSASFAPSPTSRLRRPGGWGGPAQTGRAAPPTGRR